MNLFLFALLLLFTGSLIVLPIRRSELASRIGTLTVVTATALAIIAALTVLLTGTPSAVRLPWAVPGADFSLLLDPLAAFFVLPIAVVSLACAVYAGAYLRHDGQKRALAPHWFFFIIMVIAMLLVVTAANSVLFLCAWEIMTLSSFFLVAWDHREAAVRSAAWLYLLAAHCGMMLLIALFLLAGYYCGSLDFCDFGPLAQLPASKAALLFLLALFGFGVKAGLFPVHIWLPSAHPAAPSHVSAIMSAVLIKTGIYGILRILSLLPAAPAWWGWLVTLLGAAGALYGISLAAQQRDIKRCLAYSTVENIGIILLGLGFGMVACAHGHPTIALFAYAGGLLHLWNHALFKGVMFLGAGALVHATASRDMNHMGGLLRHMPRTALLWIGGSLAIAALPPLNGLVSEWLIYLSLVRAGTADAGFFALAPLLLFGLLGLVGALALLTFSRLIGICLLGEPRSEAAANAHEAPATMLFSMGTLLSLCLAIGLFPAMALRLMSTTLATVSRAPDQQQLHQSVVALGHGNLGVWLGLAGIAAVLLWLRRHRPVAHAKTWGCGYRFPSARMSYSAEGYSEFAFRHLLPKIMRPQLSGGKVKGLFAAPASLAQTADDPVLTRGLQPLFIRLAERFQRLRWLQQGQLPIYLCYIFIASTVLVAWCLWKGALTGG